jgi:hypothetical protein
MSHAHQALARRAPCPPRSQSRRAELASRRFRVAAGIVLGVMMLAQWAGLLGVPWIILFVLAPIFYIWIGEVMRGAYIALFVQDE